MIILISQIKKQKFLEVKKISQVLTSLLVIG